MHRFAFLPVVPLTLRTGALRSARRVLPVLAAAGILVPLVALGCRDGPVEPHITFIVVTSPVDTLLVRGHTVQLSAVASDAAGAAVPGVEFSWTSSNVQVATTSESGLVGALEPGATTITATALGPRTGGASGSLDVRIVPADLGAVSGLLDDPFAEDLVGSLSSGRRSAVDDALDGCARGASAGNVVAILACLAAARGEVGSATDPTDRALLAILALYLDAIERLLAL